MNHSTILLTMFSIAAVIGTSIFWLYRDVKRKREFREQAHQRYMQALERLSAQGKL